MSVLNYYALQREVQTRAKNRGLTIKFEEHCCPHTDSKSIVLQTPRPDMTESDAVVWWYMFEHELGHNHPELQGTWTLMREKGLNMNSLLGFTFNCLEDHRQELYGNGEYRGRDMRIQAGFHKFITEKIDPSHMGTSGNQERDMVEALMVWDIGNRVSWMPKVAGISEQFARHMTSDQQGWINKLNAGDYGITLKSGIDEVECYDLCLRILDEVFGINQSDAEASSQPQQQSGGQGDGQEGRTDGDGQASEGSDNSGVDRNSSDDGSQVDGQRGGEGTSDIPSERADTAGTGEGRVSVDYNDLLAHGHDGDGYGQLVDGQYHIDYSKYDEVGIMPTRGTNEFETHDYVKRPPAGFSDCSRGKSPYAEKGLEIASNNGLSKKVKRMLMVRSQARYQHAQKRGKISPKSIFRAGLKGEAQRKVFKKRDQNDILDTSVSMLVDFSGSMSDVNKMPNAIASMLMLNDAISSIGVPLEIIGFSTSRQNGRTCPKHGILKGFNKRVHIEQLAYNCNAFISTGMSSNSDGESLVYAYERLTKQKSKRKILLVISDGQPSCVGVDAMGHTRMVAKQIEKDGLVELRAIGLVDDTVESIYSRSAVIYKCDELEGAVLNVIKDHIIN